jgi:hypothetical protein
MMRAAVCVAMGIVASIAACHSTTVVPAQKCADPCCGGNAANVDCGENLNLACTEDADPCTARTYGCVDGSYYVTPSAVPPSSCNPDEAGTEAGGLFLPGDGGGE